MTSEKIPVKKNFYRLLFSLKDYLLTKIGQGKDAVLSGISTSKTQYLVALALIVGFVAGFTAYLFHVFLGLLGQFSAPEDLPQQAFDLLYERRYIFLFPVVGGLITGGLIKLIHSEYRGQGVPEVIHALLKRGGRMKIRATFLKSWGAIATIGSGGSAGPEGPIAEIGAATGSFLGRIFSAPPQIMRMLVAGGAAGGIAASFHAPIGGVFFALEVLLSEFTNRAFSMVVLSTVTATIVSRYFVGGEPYFSAPLYVMGPSWEIILFALLGVIAAFASKFYVMYLDGVESLFSGLKKIPLWLKPAIGGLLVGAIALVVPQIMGSGHLVIERVLWGNVPFYLMLALLFAKPLATAITLGSGGIGGVFLPGFFVGAMLGGSYGLAVKTILAHAGIPLVSGPGAFALVGMAAIMAGSTRAPMTSIIIIFEITNDYHMILPVMVASVLSTLLTRSIEGRTIYTRHLSMRGLKEHEHISARAMESTTVGEIMAKKVVTVSPGLTLNRLARLVETRGHSGFPVLNEKKDLVGLVTFEELRHALGVDGLPRDVIVTGDLMRVPPPVIFPDQTVGEALATLSAKQIDRLAVVERENQKKLLGIVTQSDILSIYRKLLT